jgi:hypothetical protein
MDLADALFGPGPLYSRYFSAIRALKPGLKVLASSEPDTDEAHILLSGFCAEGLLKAAIAYALRDNKELKDKSVYGHDLVELHARAVGLGVNLTSVSVEWLRDLSVFHNRPFFIRYQEAGGFYSLPCKAALQATLSALYKEVAILIGVPTSAA